MVISCIYVQYDHSRYMLVFCLISFYISYTCKGCHSRIFFEPWRRVGLEVISNGMEDCSRFSNLKLVSFSRRTLPGLAWLHLNSKHPIFVRVFVSNNTEAMQSSFFQCLKVVTNCFPNHYTKTAKLYTFFVYSLFYL